VSDASPLSAALEAWVLASLPRAVAFARSLVRDPSVADDLVQECYCKLLHKAADYDLPRDGTRLLFTALTRACIDRHRRERGRTSLDELLDGTDDQLPEALADLRSPDPVAEARTRELQEALEVALATLPVLQRAAVELKGMGYSLREIASALEVSESHAGVLIHRARHTLATRLRPFRDEVPR
jgi:RNA polymerase sigma-70 factor (ECF subfamily)